MLHIKQYLIISCYKATLLIEKELHVKLSLTNKLSLYIHQSLCAPCRNYEKQSHLINNLMSHNEINDFSNQLQVKAQIALLKYNIVSKLWSA